MKISARFVVILDGFHGTWHCCCDIIVRRLCNGTLMHLRSPLDSSCSPASLAAHSRSGMTHRATLSLLLIQRTYGVYLLICHPRSFCSTGMEYIHAAIDLVPTDHLEFYLGVSAVVMGLIGACAMLPVLFEVNRQPVVPSERAPPLRDTLRRSKRQRRKRVYSSN